MDGNFERTIKFADFTFETDGNILFRAYETVPLEPVAARVLRHLLENGGRLVSKDELLDAVWGDVFTTEDVLKRAVSQIRRALGDNAQNPRFIETLHRRGYRFLINRERAEKPHQTEKSTEIIYPQFDCFIGRAAEMDFLQTEFRRCSKDGNHSPILISGEPGIGKTQVATRFAAWAEKEENAVPLRARFFDYEASYIPPFDLFLDLLREACESVFGENKIEDLRAFIEEKLKITLPEELFSNAVGVWRASADASRAIAPLAECFVRLSRLQPLVLLFDDLQWVDETSRRIISYLLRIATDAPLMIIGLTRRGDTENRKKPFAEWLQTQAAYRSFTTLVLSALSEENCRDLIGEIFHRQININDISAADLQKLHLATSGNPYFIVETVRLLIGENVIEKNDTGWRWLGLKDVPLPETVRMAARAKLVNLSREAHDLIECAAVLGDSFQIEILALMIHETTAEDSIETALDEAIAAQVLTEQSVVGADDCQFYHTILRRAVYMDLSPRRRKRLHFRAANALEKSFFGELERHAAALGSHYENAGEFALAFSLNLQACRSATRRFDWAEAAELLNRAERIALKTKLLPKENLRFLSLRGEIYLSVGRRTEAEKILTEAAALEPENALINLNFGRTLILLGKYKQAIPVLEKSLQTATTDENRSSALIQIASAKYALCEYEESCEILQEIIAREPPTSYNRAVALGKLGWTRGLQSRYAEAKDLLEQAFKFHQKSGDLRERAVLAMCLNWCEYGTGNYEAAVEYANRARSEAQIVGEPYNESVAMMRIGKTRIAQGLFEEAETILLATREKQKTLGAPHAEAETIWMLGRLRAETGDFDIAEKDLKIALEMIIQIGDRDDEFRILLDQGFLQNRRGNYAKALELLNEAEKIAKEIGIAQGIGEILTEKSFSYLNLKNIPASIESAEKAVEILENCSSGELWRAVYALAKVEKTPARIEINLRRAVKILEEMREQFLPDDETRRRQFTNSHRQPAENLRDFLKSDNRQIEAEEICKNWQINLY